MSDDLGLAAVKDCLGTGLPCPLATCGADGTPHLTYISAVRCLDDERVATSRQASNAGLADLRHNPSGQCLVIRPATGEEFRIDLHHLHTLTAGEEFEAMRAAIEPLAGDGPARLRGVDIHRVVRCTAVPRGVASPGGPAPVDPFVVLDRFAQHLAGAHSDPELRRRILDALEDVCGFASGVLFTADPSTGRLVATGTTARGAAVPVSVPAQTLAAEAARRRRPVVIVNQARAWAIAGESATGSAQPTAASVIALPLLHGERLLGVLYLDSPDAYAFTGPIQTQLRVVAAHTATALAAQGATAASAPPHLLRIDVPEDSAGEPLELVYYRADDTVLCDSGYVAKGAPGRILWHLLEQRAVAGRVEFTNRELRLDQRIGLPVGNDNLEARLLALRRRLDTLDCGVRLDHVGRGRVALRLERSALLRVVEPAAGQHMPPSFFA